MGEEEKKEAGTRLRSTAALIRTLMALLYEGYALCSHSCVCTTTSNLHPQPRVTVVFSAYSSPV